MPSTRNLSHSASSASGSIINKARPSEMASSRGSARYPRRKVRHRERIAGGSSSLSTPVLLERLIPHLLAGLVVLRFGGRASLIREARRLQVEHRPIATAERDELVVAAQFDDLALLDDADAIGQAHGREPV